MKWCADLHNNQLSPIHYNFINLQFWSVAMKKVEIVMILFIVGFIYSSAYGWDHADAGPSFYSLRTGNYFKIHFDRPDPEFCRDVLSGRIVPPHTKTFRLNVPTDTSAEKHDLSHFMHSNQWHIKPLEIKKKLGNTSFIVNDHVEISILQNITIK